METASSEQRIFYGWWTVVLLFYTLVHTAGNGFYAISVYVPRLIEDLQCTTANLMLGSAVWAVVFGFSNPLVGSWLQRFGARKVLAWGIGGAGIVALLMSVMTELWHLYVINAFAGVVGAATILVPAQTLVSTWFKKRRGLAMGLALMGIGAGGFLIPQLAAWLIQIFSDWAASAESVADASFLLRLFTLGGGELSGWRGAFRVGVILNYALVLPPVLLFMKDKPSEAGQYVDGISPDSEGGLEASKPAGVPAKRARTTRVFWLLVALYLVQLTVMSGIQMNMQNFAEREAGYSLVMATSFMSFALFVTMPMRFMYGWLCDRVDPKYLMASAGVFLFTGSLVLWVFVVELGWVNYGAIYLFAVVQGCGIAGNAVAFPILVGRCFGEREFARIMGLVMSGFAIGVILGPYLVGLIFDTTGSYEISFWGCMGFAIVSVVLALLVPTTALQKEFTTADDAAGAAVEA